MSVLIGQLISAPLRLAHSRSGTHRSTITYDTDEQPLTDHEADEEQNEQLGRIDLLVPKAVLPAK
jgi:hypothetical protein